MTSEQFVAMIKSYDEKFLELMVNSGAAKEKKGHLIFTGLVSAIAFAVTYWAYHLTYAFPGAIVAAIVAFFLFGDEADEAADKALQSFVEHIRAQEGQGSISAPTVVAKIKVWYRLYEGPFEHRSAIARTVAALEKENAQWSDKINEIEQQLLALLPQPTEPQQS